MTLFKNRRELVLGNEAVGVVFEVDPRLLAAYDIRAERVAFAVLELAPLRSAVIEETAQVRRVDHLPQVERDLAVIVGKRVPARDVATVIRDSAGSRLAHLELFDRYQGPPLADDEISLAYRLRFQPADAPMSDTDIDNAIDAVIRALESEVGGRIRSGG